MVLLLCAGIEVGVELVHGRYDCSDAGRILRKEQRGFFVFLWMLKHVSSRYILEDDNDIPQEH